MTALVIVDELLRTRRMTLLLDEQSLLRIAESLDQSALDRSRSGPCLRSRSRITQLLKKSATRREAEEPQISPAERRFVEEPVEDHAADTFAAEHLGGIDPERLLQD